jgi:hypothetical protein
MHAALSKTQDLWIGIRHIANGYQDRFPRFQRSRSPGVDGERQARVRLPQSRDRGRE